MLGTTVSTLHRQVDRYPDKVFIFSETGNLTFKQYDNKVNQLANFLHGQGIGRKDNVGLLMVNCPEIYIAILAIHKLGAVACLWNFRLTNANMEYLVQSTDAKGIVFNKEFMDKVPDAGSFLRLCVDGANSQPDSVIDYSAAVSSQPTTPPSTPEAKLVTSN